MAALEAEIFGDEQKDDLPEEFKTMSAEDIQRRCATLAAAEFLQLAPQRWLTACLVVCYVFLRLTARGF
jgi:hypothetical protein